MLAALLLEHGRAAEAAAVVVPALQRLQEDAGLAFDQAQHLLWDDALLQPPPPILWQLPDLLPLYPLAAAVCTKAARSDEARVWGARGSSLEAVLSGDRSRVVPCPLREATTASTGQLVAALNDEHPGARRQAAAEVLRRLGDGFDDDVLQACARAVLEAQGRAPARWFADSGRLVEAAWARGLLVEAERSRYLTQAVRGVDVFVSVTPVGPVVVSLACWGRLRLSPDVTVGQPEREHSELEAVLKIFATRIDGRSVTVLNRDGEQPPREVSLTAVFGSARVLDWQPQPGRHALDLDGVVEVTCRGKRPGSEPATVRVPVAVRAPFFSVR